MADDADAGGVTGPDVPDDDPVKRRCLRPCRTRSQAADDLPLKPLPPRRRPHSRPNARSPMTTRMPGIIHGCNESRRSELSGAGQALPMCRRPSIRTRS